MHQGRIILASRSPRRAQLLRDAGYSLIRVDPPFNDPPQPPVKVVDACALATELAHCKAMSLLHDASFHRHTGDVLLAADTIVIAPPPLSELLGQPSDIDDARRMLGILLGNTHTVVTGVALCHLNTDSSRAHEGLHTFADVAQVTMGHAPDAWIDAYLQAGHWQGKAGGYNLTELHEIDVRVAGDPTTVVGLPMMKLRLWLEHQGFRAMVK
ncbi:MAG: Maf-like protein [Phycisphaerales bacterium]|nr:Maf-like protein [Phycisphaerales bacterium]